MPALKFTPLKECPTNWKGRKVKDLSSGWEGFCVGKFDYMNGCTRIEIAGPDKDGKPESYVFDIQQVAWANAWMDGFKPQEPMTAGLPLAKVGGPRTAPASRKNPTR